MCIICIPNRYSSEGREVEISEGEEPIVLLIKSFLGGAIILGRRTVLI